MDVVVILNPTVNNTIRELEVYRVRHCRLNLANFGLPTDLLRNDKQESAATEVHSMKTNTN